MVLYKNRKHNKLLVNQKQIAIKHAVVLGMLSFYKSSVHASFDSISLPKTECNSNTFVYFLTSLRVLNTIFSISFHFYCIKKIYYSITCHLPLMWWVYHKIQIDTECCQHVSIQVPFPLHNKVLLYYSKQHFINYVQCLALFFLSDQTCLIYLVNISVYANFLLNHGQTSE